MFGISRKLIAVGLVVILVAGVLGFLVLTSPWSWRLLHPGNDEIASGAPDLQNGKTMFLAGDCATCHISQGQSDDTLLGGGAVLKTGFGTFYMPNVSPDTKDGIGNWTLEQFTRAVRQGVGIDSRFPDGENLYPAFPYTSYRHMKIADVRDLFAYMKTLPPVSGKAPEHDLKFPFTMRRGVGVWRLAFLNAGQLAPDASKDARWNRGQYLVEGPAHCAECHSPRSFMGNIPSDKRYAGGPDTAGTGYFPNITSHDTGIGYWSVNEIASYLKTGVSPINQTAGGDMGEVIKNTARLSDEDRLAMAVYIKSIPAIDAPNRGVPEPNRTDQVVMLPDGWNATRKVNLPASAPGEIAKSATVYAVKTKPFFLAEAGVGSKDEKDGALLGAAKLTILARNGDKLQVRLDGWQMKGAESVFYAQQGQRIMPAVLGQNAIAKVVSTKSVIDSETKQAWSQGSLTFWIGTEGLQTSLPAVWDYTASLYNDSCAVCHSLPPSGHYLANQWIGNLNAMKRFTSLGDDEYRLLLAYLQNHSKDVHDAGATQ